MNLIFDHTITIGQLLVVFSIFTSVGLFWLLWRTSVEVRFEGIRKDIEFIKKSVDRIEKAKVAPHSFRLKKVEN